MVSKIEIIWDAENKVHVYWSCWYLILLIQFRKLVISLVDLTKLLLNRIKLNWQIWPWFEKLIPQTRFCYKHSSIARLQRYFPQACFLLPMKPDISQDHPSTITLTTIKTAYSNATNHGGGSNHGCSFLGLLTHLPLDKMVTISQTTLSNAFSWRKKSEFWLKFHLS